MYQHGSFLDYEASSSTSCPRFPRLVIECDQVTSSELRELLNSYSTSGAIAFWEGLDTQAGEKSILARFQAMGLWAVALAAAVALPGDLRARLAT